MGRRAGALLKSTMTNGSSNPTLLPILGVAITIGGLATSKRALLWYVRRGILLTSVVFVICFLRPSLARAQDCLTCHSTSSGLKDSAGKPITVDPAQLKNSVHSDFPCVMCRASAAQFPHTAKEAAASCNRCHSDIPKVLAGSTRSLLGDTANPQTCIACHGAHDVKASSSLGTQICTTCHSSEVAQYNSSIHGLPYSQGNGDAPVCQNCHGPAHQVVTTSDGMSPVHKTNLANTCGTSSEVFQAFLVARLASPFGCAAATALQPDPCRFGLDYPSN
jgi:hypothetical protein